MRRSLGSRRQLHRLLEGLTRRDLGYVGAQGLYPEAE